MKKITIILPDLCGGGAERLHVNLANDWVKRGFLVEFVLMQKQGELLSLLSEPTNVTGLGVDRIRHFILPLQKYLRRSQPDIILSAMWPLTSATVIAWLLSGKQGRLVLSDHNHLSISCIGELNVSPFFLNVLIRTTYPFADGIIAVSRGVKEDLCHLGGFADALIKVIYNPAATGISSLRETPEVSNKLWGAGCNHHILSVGTLKKVKDHATLIRAFAHLSSNMKAKLIILGDGQLREELENLIAELKLQDRVSMPGFVTDPYPWYRSADLFVLSSQREGFGNVIVEALECGVPVVSTNCPSGPSEILKNGRLGKLVPVEDPGAMASAMEEALTEPHDREQLMARAKEFSIRNISNEYLAYFFPLESKNHG